MSTIHHHRAPWRNWLHRVIFGTDTKVGRGFDMVLLVAIIASVLAVMVESVASIRAEHQEFLIKVEWFFTILFTIEYVLRLLASTHPARYARSFYGIIDLLCILPTYLTVLTPDSMFATGQGLLVLRVLRLLRMFRVLKLTKYVSETAVIGSALVQSKAKVIVFFTSVLTVMIVMGTVMYMIEGPEHGFDSIPTGIYWAIITVTTVGYGDISPGTAWGKVIASAGVLIGYAIIAVPTGIVTSEFERARRRVEEAEAAVLPECGRCGKTRLPKTSRFCIRCGEAVESVEEGAEDSDEN